MAAIGKPERVLYVPTTLPSLAQETYVRRRSDGRGAAAPAEVPGTPVAVP